MSGPTTYPPLLAGLRVLDLSHQYAGALSAALLGDLGADVVVVEHPTGSMVRTMLPRVGNESLWWKVMGRGKRALSLNLSTDEGRKLLLDLAGHFDVIVENFRPGTLERWGVGPTDIEAAGYSVVMLRISGFGQTGPMSARPGFGTAAEAMSGFAHLTGEPDGPPVFSSATLADGVTAVFGAFGLMAALASRRGGAPGPQVEVVDIALYESLFRIIPTQIPGFDQLGEVARRPGNSLFSHGSLRNVYTSADGRDFIVAAVGPQTVQRILDAVGATDLAARTAARMADEPAKVQSFLYECDEQIKAFVDSRTFDEIETVLTDHGAVFQLVYSVEDIVKDNQYRARDNLISVPDADLGEILMQGIVPKFHDREHRVAEAGRAVGADNLNIYRELLGLGPDDLARLAQSGVL